MEVDEANLSKVASLVLKSEDDAVLASLTEVVGDLARIGTPLNFHVALCGARCG